MNRGRQGGFTIIELAIVIVIIGILAALLLPAITGAVRRAREASVNAEINLLAQALANFKAQYGDYPPSRVLLVENGDYSAVASTAALTPPLVAVPGTPDITLGQLAQRSLTSLRKFWPRATLSTSGPVWPAGSAVFYDFNGNGQMDLPSVGYVLDGRECLTFFLGGITVPPNPAAAGTGSAPFGMTGFNNNRSNPFLSTNMKGGNNRAAPLFEFQASRLQLLPEKQIGSPLYTGIPAYFDPNSSSANPSFYAYFSAYGGPYDPNDVNAVDPSNLTATETSDSTGTPISLAFKLPFLAAGFSASPPPNPYTVSLTYTDPNSQLTPPLVASVVYHRPQSFQIISPGADALYGPGGVFSPNAATILPVVVSTPSGPPVPDPNYKPPGDPSIRIRENDNLTNFQNGRLQ
jgi:general secretion pathway protein G